MDEPPAIQRLRDAGLVTLSSDGVKEFQKSFPDEPLEGMNDLPWLSYTLLKPSRVGGNSRIGHHEYIMLNGTGPGYCRSDKPDEDWYDPTVGIHTNAPEGEIFTIYPDSATWYFRIFTPSLMGIGYYGDFQNQFRSVDAAVADALEYYFGDPRRMNPLRLFEIARHRFSHLPTREWFEGNWEWKYEKHDLNLASVFTIPFWLACFERPIEWVYVCYSRIRYADPESYRWYRYFLGRTVSFKTVYTNRADRSDSAMRYIQIRTTVKKSVSIDDSGSIAREN